MFWKEAGNRAQASSALVGLKVDASSLTPCHRQKPRKSYQFLVDFDIHRLFRNVLCTHTLIGECAEVQRGRSSLGWLWDEGGSTKTGGSIPGAWPCVCCSSGRVHRLVLKLDCCWDHLENFKSMDAWVLLPNVLISLRKSVAWPQGL